MALKDDYEGIQDCPCRAGEKLALNTDFAPTFADLAGVAFSGDRRSLEPLLGDEDPSWRTSILLERMPTRRGYQAVRTEAHKYVEYNNG